MLYDQLIFERSKKGRKGITLPKWDLEEKPLEDLVPKKFIRTEDTSLPEVSEVDVIRHYTNLSMMNYGGRSLKNLKFSNMAYKWNHNFWLNIIIMLP
jgi:glycine cleavage system protein P-like pyridoxal-binding family